MIDLQKIEDLAKRGDGLTAKQIMHHLGIASYKTLENRVRRGEIVRVNFGGNVYYYPKCDVLAGPEPGKQQSQSSTD